MTKISVAMLAAVAALATAGLAHADEVKGGFCKTLETRVSNPKPGMVETKLWEYSEQTLGAAPVMGSIDVSCADRGAPRAHVEDMGKRLWFSFSGPEGAAASEGKVIFDSLKITGDQGSVGLTVKGPAIYGKVTARHDCIFVVAVWGEGCQSK